MPVISPQGNQLIKQGLGLMSQLLGIFCFTKTAISVGDETQKMGDVQLGHLPTLAKYGQPVALEESSPFPLTSPLTC